MSNSNQGATRTRAAPVSAIDLFSQETLLDPYPAYCEIREQGGAVWLSQFDMFILTRFADVQGALADWHTFTSAKGVMMNQRMNGILFDGSNDVEARLLDPEGKASDAGEQVDRSRSHDSIVQSTGALSVVIL